MITFEAKPIKSTTIKQLNTNSVYKNIPVYFAQLDPKSKYDYNSLQKAIESWRSADLYGASLFRDFKERAKIYAEKRQPKENEKFWVITTQLKDFDKLKPRKILGVMKTVHSSNKGINIEFLQTNPKYKYGEIFRRYKNIGEAIWKSFVSTINKDTIYVCSTKESIDFYTKMGMKSYMTYLFKFDVE